MLKPDVAREVRRLLQGRWTDRQIAAMTGAGRSTVCRMRHRPPVDRPAEADSPTAAPEAPEGPPRRCSGCGGWTPQPCRVCAVRQRRGQPTPGPDPGPLGLELHPPHRRRYEAVRAQRESGRPSTPRPSEWKSGR